MTKKTKTLYRLPEEGKIAGVCAGLSEYFEFDVTLMRIFWVIATLLTGGGLILAYIVLAIVLPVPGGSKNRAKVKFDAEIIEENVNQLEKELQEKQFGRTFSNLFGFGLIVLGSWFLLSEFFPEIFDIRWDYIWPVIVIATGLAIVLKKR
jgi:phage shock protein C